MGAKGLELGLDPFGVLGPSDLLGLARAVEEAPTFMLIGFHLGDWDVVLLWVILDVGVHQSLLLSHGKGHKHGSDGDFC